MRQAKKNSRRVSEKDGVCRGGRSEDSTARSVLAGAWRPLRAYSIFSRSPTELLRALPWFSLRSEPICVYELPQVLLAQKNHRKFTSARGADPRVTQQPRGALSTHASAHGHVSSCTRLTVVCGRPPPACCRTGAAGGRRQPPWVQQRDLVCIRAPRACRWVALTRPEQLRSGGSLCLDEQRWIAKPAEERRAAAPTP